MPNPNGGPGRRNLIPREPIAEAIRKVLQNDTPPGYDPFDPDEMQSMAKSKDITPPKALLILRVARILDVSPQTVERRVRAILSGMDYTSHRGSHMIPLDYITFRYADAILCACNMPHLFYADPRLRPYYEEIT